VADELSYRAWDGTSQFACDSHQDSPNLDLDTDLEPAIRAGVEAERGPMIASTQRSEGTIVRSGLAKMI